MSNSVFSFFCFFSFLVGIWSDCFAFPGRSKQHLEIQVSNSGLPSPYCDIRVLPYDGHGWYGNGKHLESLIRENKISIVVEVGSWLGASTCHIASLLPPGGLVYAIDHWQGSEEHQPGQSAWYKALPYLYQQFLSNVIHKGLAYKIRPFRMASLEAANMLSVQPDLIYLDAAHHTESVYRDLNAWFPFVKGKGILCGDDWAWPSVVAAVVQFAQENDLEIYSEGNFWRLIE